MKIEYCPFTLADNLRMLPYPNRDSEKVIESYREKSKLLSRSIEIRSPVLELVRPVFTKALYELENSSPWFEAPYFRSKEYEDVVEDLHNNLVGNRDLSMATSSNVPVRVPSYVGGINSPLRWALAIGSIPLTIIPWIFICRSEKRSREGITREVFSLDPKIKCVQDINYIDTAVRKYFLKQRRLFR